MIDEETLAQINVKYVCPQDAGPAWRAAAEAGIDMTLIEYALKLTPDQRLAGHQQVLNFLLDVQETDRDTRKKRKTKESAVSCKSQLKISNSNVNPC